MSLWVPSSNDFRWQVSSTVQRPGTNYGATVNPSGTANTYGSYQQLISGASVTEDVYFILINFNSWAVSAQARDMIATIGLDPAGGTSYTDTIQHLLITGATPYNVGSGGVWYAFPLFIPAGTSIAVKVSQNNTALNAGRCWVQLFGRPARPETVRVGRFVETIGAVTASSRGTSVTSGTTSDGSLVSLGTTTNDTWWHQLGFGVNDNSMVTVAYHMDLAADSAGSKLLIQDLPITTTTAEQVNNSPLTAGCTANVPGGTTLYGRMQCSGTPDTGLSMIAYCLGG